MAEERAEVAVEVDFDRDGLHALRSTLLAHASEIGLPQDQIERLVIVAVELATNAIRHAGGQGRLTVWQRDGAIVCRVSDTGPGFADEHVGLTLPSPDAIGGRGVWIARQLSSSFMIEPGADGIGAVVTVAIGSPDGNDRP